MGEKKKKKAKPKNTKPTKLERLIELQTGEFCIISGFNVIDIKIIQILICTDCAFG